MFAPASVWNDRWGLWSPNVFGFIAPPFGIWVLRMFITHVGNICHRKLLDQSLESHESPNGSWKHQCCTSTCWIKLLSAKINCLSLRHPQFYRVLRFQSSSLPRKASLPEKETPFWLQQLPKSGTVFLEILPHSLHKFLSISPWPLK